MHKILRLLQLAAEIKTDPPNIKSRRHRTSFEDVPDKLSRAILV
jgi:hypothetical protein